MGCGLAWLWLGWVFDFNVKGGGDVGGRRLIDMIINLFILLLG